MKSFGSILHNFWTYSIHFFHYHFQSSPLSGIEKGDDGLFSFTMNQIDHTILWPYMSMIWIIDFSHRLFWHWFLYWHYGKVFTEFSFPTFNLSRLWTRKEKEIAIVTHSGFLFHTLSAFGSDCHPSVKSEICTQ